MEVKIGLGWARIARNAGFLSVAEDLPSPALYTPATLHCYFRRDNADVDIVRDSQEVIKQVKVPEGLANVVIHATNSYSVEMYSATNVLSKTNGVYQITNSPFTTISITSLDFDTTRFQLSKDGVVLYNFNWTGSGWEMVCGGGLRTETKRTRTN